MGLRGVDTNVPEEIEVPTDDLAVGEPVEGADEAEEIVLTALDIAEYANHTVDVKVNGEIVRVPLSEAVAGYQRHSDYTSKTQEVAAQKEQIQWATAMRGALDNDPAGTLKLLSAHYGVDAVPAVSVAAPEDSWAEDPDPRYASLEQRLAVFEEAQATANLHADLNRLQTKYGEDFDPKEVVAAALQLGSQDLEATFKQIAFDRILAKGTASKAATATQVAAAEAKRVGGLAAGGSVPRPSTEVVGAITSIDDAWAAAKRQHGI